jgi:RecA-family ATPase
MRELRMSEGHPPQTPSHSIEAEQSVLGGLMLDADAWPKVADLITGDSFYRDDHRQIFAAIAHLRGQGTPTDTVTVSDHLERTGRAADVGGLAYLGIVTRDTPTAANIRAYADIVREHAKKRALARIGEGISASALNGSTASEILTSATEQLERLRIQGDGEKNSVPLPAKPIVWESLTGEPPSRAWVIPDWFGMWPMVTAGAGGAGKTRLWQAIATALATGRAYLGPATKPLKVLTWSCEDDADEVWRTQAAINAHFSLDMTDLKDRLHIVPRMGCENTIMDVALGKPSFTPQYLQLRDQVNDLGIDVLVLDNIAQVYGGNLSDPHQVTMFVNGIAGLVRGRPFAPVLLGHVAKGPGSEFSGTMAWENAVRMRWYLGPTLPDQQSDEGDMVDPDVVYLARRKANYSNKDWRRLRFQNGLLVPDDPEGQGFDQVFRNDAAERVVIEGMAKLKAIGVAVTDGKTSPDYLPSQIIAKGYAQSHTKKELTAAMNRLMGAGRLVRRVIGTYANRTQRQGLVMS